MLNLSVLTLKFSHHSLEKQFADYQATNLKRLERVFTVVFGLFSLGVSLHQAKRHGSVVAPLVSAFLGLVLLVPRCSLGPTARGRHSLYPVRWLILVTTITTSMLLVVEPVKDWGTLWEVLILKTALPVHMAVLLGLPVLFWNHIPIHAFETWLIVASLAPAFCSTATKPVNSDSPGFQHDFYRIWDCIDTVALRVLEGMFGRAVYNTAACPSEGACYQLFVFLHLFFGGCIASYVSWLRERAARAAFLAHEWEAEGREERQQGVRLERVLGVVLVVHVLVFITLFAGLWRALGTFTMALPSDGLFRWHIHLWDQYASEG